MGSFTYVGSELDLFSQCVRWKDYFRSRLAPHIGSDVLEVGAGWGGFAVYAATTRGCHVTTTTTSPWWVNLMALPVRLVRI